MKTYFNDFTQRLCVSAVKKSYVELRLYYEQFEVEQYSC